MKQTKYKITIHFLLIILLSTSISQASIISGIVVDSLTNKPLPGANIYLDRKNIKGIATDINGKFIIKEIPSGAYELNIQLVGYYTKHVGVILYSNIDSLFVTIPVHWGYKINCDTCYYNYQKILKAELESHDKGVEFIIAKCHVDKNILARVKIKNNLNIPVYFPKNFRYLPVYKEIIMDENNHIIKSYDFVDMGCDVPYKFKYDEADITEIGPNEEKIIDTVEILHYNLDEFKNKEIKLKLIYNFDINREIKKPFFPSNFPTDEDMKKLPDIYCKIFNGPSETKWKKIVIK